MKRFIFRSGVAVAMVLACLRIAGPQAPDPSLQSASTSDAIIPSGHLFIMQLDTPMHTNTTKKGDKVEFHTAADIMVDNRILIPYRSLVRAEVKKSKRAGMLFSSAEIQLRLLDVKLLDGTVLPFQAAITRSGFDPVDTETGKDPKLKSDARRDADVRATVSAGAQGAVIGVITGGLRGAMYGAGAGAASSILNGVFRRGPDLDLPRNTMFEARFQKPLTIPAQSVLAQNNPANAHSQSASLNAPSEELVANNRPVLRHPRDTQPIEEASISRTAPAGDPSLADEPGEEPSAKPRPVLRRPQSEPPIEEASISKPDPGPVIPSIMILGDTKQVEPAIAGVKISVRVKMVQVDAVVRDRSGRIMQDLRLEDFRVYEDNVLQELAGFSQDELPLAIAIVVDRSGSVSPYISELRRIATRALDNLKPQDEVCLFSFAEDVQRLEDLTTDRHRIANAIDRIRAFGGTDIMDALHTAVRYLANAAPERRHAIILVSDNQQTVDSIVNEHEVITTAQEKDTVIYSLKTSGTPLALGAQLPSIIFGDGVDRVAQETGGEVIKVTRVGSLDSALDSVISRLRKSYSIGYYPSSASKSGVFHAISVQLADKFGKPGKDYSIRAKRGYYAVQTPKSAAGGRTIE
jgi:Ca-activated chloride channel homolog